MKYEFTEEALQQLLNEQKRISVKDNIMYFGVSSNNISFPDYSKFKVEENESVEFDLRERSEIVDIAIRCEESYDSRELIEWFTNKFKNRNK